MFLSNNKIENYSGYIKLDENLQIEEFSGQINQILRKGHLDLNGNLIQITEGLKKNIRFFFENEVLPAIKSTKISHLSLTRKNSILLISITPLSSGITLLSFEEVPPPAKIIDQTLPDKLKEVLIRINTNMQVVYISKNFAAKFGQKASNYIGKNLEENQLFKENTLQITNLIAQAFQQQRQQEADILIAIGEKKNLVEFIYNSGNRSFQFAAIGINYPSKHKPLQTH